MAKTKIHVTPDGPKECNASIKTCTYAQNGGEHYDNMDEAQAAYDKQMKEEHGSFAVKKTADKINVNDDLDNRDITDALKNTLADTDMNYDRALFKEEFLQGNTLGEIKDNINKIYDEYNKSDRITRKDLEKEIIKNSEFNSGIKISDEFGDYSVNVYGNSVYFEKTDYEEYSEALQNADKPEKEPLKEGQRRLIKRTVDDLNQYDYKDYDDDTEDNYDDDVSTIETTYEYRISEAEAQRLENQDRFEIVKDYKEVLDDPEQPDWVVLPKQKNHRNRSKDYDPYAIRKPYKDEPVRMNYKLEQEKEKLTKSLKTAQNSKKRLSTLENKYNKSVEELNELKKNKASLDSINEKETESANNKKLFDRAQQKGSEENIDKIKTRLTYINNTIKENDQKISDNDKLKYEDYLASRYPSTDAKERRKAAQQWIKDNS